MGYAVQRSDEPLWISKVEDINSNEDSVQLSNPINDSMSRQSYLRSTTAATRRPIRSINLSELTRESAAFVTFSQSSVRQSTTYTATLSGVDETLFAAD